MIIDLTQTRVERRLNHLQMQHTVGAFLNRGNITILPADDPRKRRLGWVIREEVGIVVINDYALSRLAVGENNDN